MKINEWFYILVFCFFVTVFTIGKEFAVWTGSKSFWNYFGLGASQKSDYLSIVLSVGLVDSMQARLWLSKLGVDTSIGWA